MPARLARLGNIGRFHGAFSFWWKPAYLRREDAEFGTTLAGTAEMTHRLLTASNEPANYQLFAMYDHLPGPVRGVGCRFESGHDDLRPDFRPAWNLPARGRLDVVPPGRVPGGVRGDRDPER